MFSGWVIVNATFGGQRFTDTNGTHRFIQFICSEQGFIGLLPVADPCVPRLGLMHPAFCVDMDTDIMCVNHSDAIHTVLPSFTSRPTQFPTRRPDAPSDKPTPRPTYSALPTRRPTLSALPTRVFRSLPPRQEAKIMRSRISIEVRNETMFENPKNVEAVVKTIVCALKVPAENVQVNGIKHYVDNVLIGTIPVPVRNTSRNITDECMGTGPTHIPIPPQPSPVEPVAFRRLQSGLDTYVLDYQVNDPPASIVALEPATVASLIETSSTLVSSLDLPPNSYVAMSAEPPTYTAEPNIVANQGNPVLTQILMGVLIPLGVVLFGSVIAMTVKKRARALTSNPTTIMQFAPTIPSKTMNEIHPKKIDSSGFTQTNPSPRVQVVRLASKHSIGPMQVRKV
jgi:hypothetical protein